MVKTWVSQGQNIKDDLKGTLPRSEKKLCITDHDPLSKEKDVKNSNEVFLSFISVSKAEILVIVVTQKTSIFQNLAQSRHQ